MSDIALLLIWNYHHSLSWNHCATSGYYHSCFVYLCQHTPVALITLVIHLKHYTIQSNHFFKAFRVTSHGICFWTIILKLCCKKPYQFGQTLATPPHFFVMFFWSGKFLTFWIFLEITRLVKYHDSPELFGECLYSESSFSNFSPLLHTKPHPHTLPGPPKSFPDVFHYMWWRERPFFREIPFRYFPPGIYGNMCRGEKESRNGIHSKKHILWKTLHQKSTLDFCNKKTLHFFLNPSL